MLFLSNIAIASTQLLCTSNKVPFFDIDKFNGLRNSVSNRRNCRHFSMPRNEQINYLLMIYRTQADPISTDGDTILWLLHLYFINEYRSFDYCTFLRRATSYLRCSNLLSLLSYCDRFLFSHIANIFLCWKHFYFNMRPNCITFTRTICGHTTKHTTSNKNCFFFVQNCFAPADADADCVQSFGICTSVCALIRVQMFHFAFGFIALNHFFLIFIVLDRHGY